MNLLFLWNEGVGTPNFSGSVGFREATAWSYEINPPLRKYQAGETTLDFVERGKI